MGIVLNELNNLQQRIKQLESENAELRYGATYTRILELEAINKDLRGRLNQTYEFIHNHGNPDYKNQLDWDGVATESHTTGNSERLNHLTRKFGIDEYPLE
jgi:hypothetical protein